MKKSSKIINDPLYGFIGLESEIILKIVNHPYFQRLRRISQLGLTSLVYPGAIHTISTRYWNNVFNAKSYYSFTF